MNDVRDFTFSPDPAINASVQNMLPHFSEESQRRMRKAIRDSARSAQTHGGENIDLHGDLFSGSHRWGNWFGCYVH